MRSNELNIVYEYSSDDNFIGDLVISADREISTSELDLISQKIKEKANIRKKKDKLVENNPKKKSEAITFTKNEEVVENKSQTELDIIRIEMEERNKNWAETKQKQLMEERIKNVERKKKHNEDVQRKKNASSRKKRKEKEQQEKEQQEKEQRKELSQDLFSQYYDEHIILDSDSTLNKSNLYKDCKVWYSNNATVKCPTSHELADNMDKIYKKNIRGKWKGIAINFANDDDDDNEVIHIDECDQRPSPRTRYLQLREDKIIRGSDKRGPCK